MSVAIAYPVRSPEWILTYRGVNITADISRMVVSISYVDELGGRSGELEIELEDATSAGREHGSRTRVMSSAC
jgi:phage protein D